MVRSNASMNEFDILWYFVMLLEQVKCHKGWISLNVEYKFLLWHCPSSYQVHNALNAAVEVVMHQAPIEGCFYPSGARHGQG